MGSVQSFIQRTALRQATLREFYGRYRGFPLGLTLVGGELSDVPSECGTGLVNPGKTHPYSLLMHVRFPDRVRSTRPESPYVWGEGLRTLLEQGRARVSVEARIAWLTLYEPHDLVANEAVVDILNDFIDGLAAAGVQNAGERCHYCEKTFVKEPSYVAERVAWICPDCLTARIADAQPNEPAAPLGGLKLLLAASLGSLIGAAAWASLWIGYYSIIEWLARGRPSITVWVPTVIMVILAFGAALFIGGPPGALVRQVAGQGYFARTVSSCCGTVAAIAIGEVAWVLWLLPQLLGVRAAIGLLPAVWRAEGTMEFGLKLLVASLSSTFAFFPLLCGRCEGVQ